MTESPEPRRRPKPGPGGKPGPAEDECPVCYPYDETVTYGACGVIFSLLKAIATSDRPSIVQAQKVLGPLDAHIATHIAYIFLYNICVLTEQHPLDVIDANQDAIRESLAAG